MTDTPTKEGAYQFAAKASAESQVPAMGSGGADNTSEAMDLTAPEHVERWLYAFKALLEHPLLGDGLVASIADRHPTFAGMSYEQFTTLPRALAAKLEAAEANAGDCTATIDGRSWHDLCEGWKERTFVAEAKLQSAEAELAAYREMQAESNAQGGPSVIRLQMQARRDRISAEKAEARAIEMEGSAQAALAGYEVEREARRAAEAELDAALGVLQDIADGNPTCDSPEADAALARAFLAARQKGGEG